LASKQAAAVLTIIGGVFYLVGSVVGSIITALASDLTSLSSGFNPSNPGASSIPSISSIPNLSSSFSLAVLGFGALCGAVIIVGGALINSDNAGWRKGGGILALAAMVIGAVPDVGGLLIGFILILVGGILGLTYKPNEPDIRIGIVQAPQASSTMNSGSGTYCIKCGKQLHEGALFCKYCGSPVPQ